MLAPLPRPSPDIDSRAGRRRAQSGGGGVVRVVCHRRTTSFGIFESSTAMSAWTHGGSREANAFSSGP